jgi:hypothetical protein
MIVQTMPDERQAITELRSLRHRAERSAQEIGRELKKWQESLGRGKFKQAYMAAGWSPSTVYWFMKNQEDAIPVLESQPVELPSKPLETNVDDEPEEVTPTTTPQVCTGYREGDFSINIVDYDKVLIETEQTSGVAHMFVSVIPQEIMQSAFELALAKVENREPLIRMWKYLQKTVYKKEQQ